MISRFSFSYSSVGTLALARAAGAGVLVAAGVKFVTFSPSLFNWSTNVSTSFDFPPNFRAFRTIGFLWKDKYFEMSHWQKPTDYNEKAYLAGALVVSILDFDSTDDVLEMPPLEPNPPLPPDETPEYPLRPSETPRLLLSSR